MGNGVLPGTLGALSPNFHCQYLGTYTTPQIATPLYSKTINMMRRGKISTPVLWAGGHFWHPYHPPFHRYWSTLPQVAASS